MDYLKTSLIAGGLVALMSACSTPKPGTPAATLKILEEKKEHQSEMVEDTIDDIPSWFTDNPMDNDSVFSAGTASSPNLQLAVDKGVLNAKRMLADSIDGKVNSLLKEYMAENGRDMDPTTLTDVERTTTNILKNINVSGYTIDKLEIQEAGLHYRTYVLLRYPLGDANRIQTKILREKLLDQSRKRAREGHQELRGRTEGGV